MNRITRIAIAAIGIIAIGLGSFTTLGAVQAQSSLNAFSAAQGVSLSYNDDGVLVDRGTVEGAEAIKVTLFEDWAYTPLPGPLSGFDASDPLVNTADEFMYQMATIVTHTIHGVQTVVVPEDVTYNDEFFAAGTYEVNVDGKYYAGLDRKHPLEGPIRNQAWGPLTQALVANLGVGAATDSIIKVSLGLGGALILFGIGFIIVAVPTKQRSVWG